MPSPGNPREAGDALGAAKREVERLAAFGHAPHCEYRLSELVLGIKPGDVAARDPTCNLCVAQERLAQRVREEDV